MGKNKKNRMRKGCSVIIIGLLIFVLYLPFFSIREIQAAETVRVGYYVVANYQEVAEDGTYSGFSYDYFMQMQKYTRWNYEFVEASYSDCMKMLINGEIDIMAGIGKTEEREEQMIFSRYTVSTSQNRMYAKADNMNLFFESFDTFDGCTIAMMKGMRTDEVEQYCEQHDFQVNYRFYNSMSEMEQALTTGEVDMVCAASISMDSDTKIVARMDRQPLYLVTNKNKPEIAAELDEALRKITDNNPEFYTQMSEKYKVSGANATATFTREELEFINSGEEVYLILNKNWAPISWYDTAIGQYRGIVVDIAKKIESYSGLHITLCSEEEYKVLEAENPALMNNAMAVLADDNSWSVKQNVMMTNHILDTSVVAVSRTGKTSALKKDRTIALPERFYIGYVMREELKGLNVVYYDDIESCLKAVDNGDADLTYVNELVASYYLSMLRYTNLYATANTGFFENLAFSIYKDTDIPLLSIIDKSMLCIGTDVINQMVVANSIADERVTLEGLFYSHPQLVVFSVAFIVLLLSIGIAVIYTFFRRKKHVELELQREAETNNARTEFFMMISHELRTPLNAIVGYIDLVAQEHEKNGWELEYVKRSQKAAKQMIAIADDMLDYTKIASDTFELKEELFDLKDVIRVVDQNISLKAAQKNQAYRIIIDDLSHELLVGDSLRIAQILQNILSNGVKFTGEGGTVEAHISEENVDDRHIRFKFVCKDSGKGMTKEFTKRVCAPFNQSDKSYSRTHGGLGLGLYLAKYYVNAMDGTFDVESVLGESSTFTVTLVLTKPNSEQIIEHDVNCSHVRAIVAGKDENDNKRIKELLKRIHIKCDITVDAEKLLKRVRSRIGGEYEYSLCIVDESVVQSDWNIFEQLTELEHAPVIFTLAANTEMLDKMSMNNYIRHVLYKPIFQSVLFDAVMNTFGEYKMESIEAGKEDFTGLRAMIVEDNVVNADILTRVLAKANIDVTLCENGQEAVNTFNQAPEGTYGIIFMDIQMPVKNGYEATMEIRNSHKLQGSEIPIIAVSANAFPEDIEQSLKSGMNEHMSKPVNAQKVYQAIHKYWVRDHYE